MRTPPEVVIALRDIRKDDYNVIAPACLRRLVTYSENKGDKGVIAIQLLERVKNLLNL